LSSLLHGNNLFDLISAVIVGCIIIISAIKIFISSFSGMMDARISPSIEKEIEAIIDNMPIQQWVS